VSARHGGHEPRQEVPAALARVGGQEEVLLVAGRVAAAVAGPVAARPAQGPRQEDRQHLQHQQSLEKVVLARAHFHRHWLYMILLIKIPDREMNVANRPSVS